MELFEAGRVGEGDVGILGCGGQLMRGIWGCIGTMIWRGTVMSGKGGAVGGVSLLEVYEEHKRSRYFVWSLGSG